MGRYVAVKTDEKNRLMYRLSEKLFVQLSAVAFEKLIEKHGLERAFEIMRTKSLDVGIVAEHSAINFVKSSEWVYDQEFCGQVKAEDL